ncbi:MAG: patatin-like phospholipase family protein [Endomicrobiales bacterium]
MKKIGIALGGGGARGLSYVGALRVFEKQRLPFYCITGTSMGAIIGACYAVHRDVSVVEALVKKALSNALFSHMKFSILKDDEVPASKKTLIRRARDFIKFGFMHLVEETSNSLFELTKLEEIINGFLPDIDIAELKIPFACVATDLTNGREKIFTGGPLRRCVLASASIPGIFPPVLIDGIHYNDGGAVSVTPVKAARLLGAEFIVAVDVKSRVERWDRMEKARDIISRCNYITGSLLNDIHLKGADIVIEPGIKHLHWAEFDRVAVMIEEGEKAAAGKIFEIRSRVEDRGFVDRLMNIFRSSRPRYPA